MRRAVLLPLLVTLLLALSASAALATPLTLMLLDTTSSSLCNIGVNCAVITDNGSGDATALANVLSLNNNVVGSFKVSAQGMSSPLALGDPLDLYLAGLTVTAQSAGPSTFQLLLSNTGLSSGLAASTANAKLTSAVTAGSNGLPTAPTATYTSWITPAGVSTPLVQVGTGSGQVTNADFALASSLDLYSMATLTFSGVGQFIQGSSKLAVVNAVSTPEPSSVMLFGLGLLGLAMFTRRRGQNGIYRQFAKRGFLMKKTVLLPALVALLLLSFGASPARAAFLLDLTDGTNTVNISDDVLNDFDGTPDHITFMGSLGAFDLVIETAFVDNATTNPFMNLIETLVTFNGPTPATLSATLTRTGLNLSSIGTSWLGSSSGLASTDPSVATVAYFSTITPDGGSPIDVTSGTTPLNLPGLFSLTTKVDMTFHNPGSMDANSSVFVNPPVSTPEPSTMSLLGLGVFGLAAIGGRRRSKKVA